MAYVIFFLSTGSTGRKSSLILLLGCSLLSPSVTECHFADGKNGHSFHRISREATSWENVSCCSLEHVENGGNNVANYSLGKISPLKEQESGTNQKNKTKKRSKCK